MDLREERIIIMASGCLIILRAIFMGTHSLSGRIGVEEIRGSCAQTAQQLASVYLS